jgi:hypothetical protein
MKPEDVEAVNDACEDWIYHVGSSKDFLDDKTLRTIKIRLLRALDALDEAPLVVAE